MALNTRRSPWSRPFPQHPCTAGGGGSHHRWRHCRRACRRCGGGRGTTTRTTRACSRQRAAPAAATMAAAAVAAAATWRPCYSLFATPLLLRPAIDGSFPHPPPYSPPVPLPPHPPRRRCASAHRAARPRVCAAESDGRPASVGRWMPGWWPTCVGGSRRPPRRWLPLLTLRWAGRSSARRSLAAGAPSTTPPQTSKKRCSQRSVRAAATHRWAGTSLTAAAAARAGRGGGGRSASDTSKRWSRRRPPPLPPLPPFSTHFCCSPVCTRAPKRRRSCR